jgi:hypothetical protein
MRYRKSSTSWLVALAALTGIAVLSGTATVAVQVALLALFATALVLTLSPGRPARIVRVARASGAAARMSADAREAAARARREGALGTTDLTLLDIGLIALESSDEGMHMRRTSSPSLDDDALRPFVTLHVQPTAAERRALVRFELRDGQGKSRYVHELRPYLRAGDMNLLADHQLPLRENPDALQAGDWDLRLFIDGRLMADHVFTLTPSLENRFARARRLESREPAPRSTPADQSMSLEDLLRGQVDAEQRSRAGRQ